MTQPLLSILIPTVYGREESFNRLLNKIKIGREWNGGDTISEQWRCGLYFSNDGEIVIRYHCDNKQQTIGEKRQQLYIGSLGKYSWQIDDDDDIADNAIELILEAIKSNPNVDVISFEEYCNMDGKEYKSNHSGQYSGWEGDGNSVLDDGFHFHRTPFFKSVIRSELAKSIPIQKIRFGEDHAFANDLHQLIKSEIHISEPLYRYIHISSPHNERYGIQ